MCMEINMILKEGVDKVLAMIVAFFVDNREITVSIRLQCLLKLDEL